MTEEQIRRDCAERLKALQLYIIDVINNFKKREYNHAISKLSKVEQYKNSVLLDLEALEKEKVITDL